MATLTYDPTPADQPEFTEEEQNSIAVGESLEQQSNDLLAGKYRDASELEKAYIELQGKLGESTEEEVVEETGQEEEEEVDEEVEEVEEEVEETPYMMNDESIAVLMQTAGGQEQYDQMIGWATDNFSQQEIDMYDHVMDSGDAAAAMFAVQALKNAYREATGRDGELLTGSSAPPDPSNSFRSQAEVMAAMNDPRYDNDPAYRQDVFDKLDRSNVEY
jgi:hypothetical protein